MSFSQNSPYHYAYSLCFKFSLTHICLSSGPDHHLTVYTQTETIRMKYWNYDGITAHFKAFMIQLYLKTMMIQLLSLHISREI